jgi:hypothetical protein
MNDGVWDDGEWISWDYINHHVYLNDLRDTYPEADLEVVAVFEDLVANAIDYKALTGRHLAIFGELGELYAEIKFGIKRHRVGAPGSDGRLGNDFVEVKTISPIKNSDKVQVKRAGNFNKLVVVKIDENYKFEARMIRRKQLSKGEGKHASVSWSKLPVTDDTYEE